MDVDGGEETMSVDDAKGNEAPMEQGVPGGYKLDVGDLYISFFETLLREGKIDIKIKENESMDWRAEQSVLSQHWKTAVNQPSFIPRLGEIVLWCREMQGEIELEPESNEFMMYDTTSKTYVGHPKWMAGVVTQVPEERVDLADLLEQPEKQFAINVSGFRVECFPKPNSPDKRLSKQYTYIPMHHLRPMIFWQQILHGIPRTTWHPSIIHALDVFANFSVFNRYRIKGTWPCCNISVGGMFLGTELLHPGDVVKVLPFLKGAPVTDVMHITQIVVKFSNVILDEYGMVRATSIAWVNVLLIGNHYTMDPDQSFAPLICNIVDDETSLPKSMHGYGPWYATTSPGRTAELSFDRVMGRLYECEAMKLWFSFPRGSKLDIGQSGLREGRVYSAAQDERIESPRKWYWAICRVDGLDIAMVNNTDVGKYAKDHDPDAWLRALDIIDEAHAKAAAIGEVARSDEDRGGESETEGID